MARLIELKGFGNAISDVRKGIGEVRALAGNVQTEAGMLKAELADVHEQIKDFRAQLKEEASTLGNSPPQSEPPPKDQTNGAGGEQQVPAKPAPEVAATPQPFRPAETQTAT